MATSEQNSTDTPTAHKEVNSVLSSDTATRQSFPYEPDLERLLRSLNPYEDTHEANRSMPLQDPFETKSISVSGRIDTGTALSVAQNYQIERPETEESVATEGSHRHDAGAQPSSNDLVSSSQGYSPRPNTQNDNSARESTTPTGLAKTTTTSGAPRFRIGYGKLLIISLVSQLVIENLLALCANNILGWYGLVAVGACVTVAFFFKMFSIVFTVASEVKDPKSASMTMRGSRGILFPLFRVDY